MSLIDCHPGFFFSSEATVKIKPISGSTTIADSTVEVEVDPIVQGEEVTEEDITGTVMAGVVTREVVEGMELVATEAVVGSVLGDVTAVAAARLEAW